VESAEGALDFRPRNGLDPIELVTCQLTAEPLGDMSRQPERDVFPGESRRRRLRAAGRGAGQRGNRDR